MQAFLIALLTFVYAVSAQDLPDPRCGTAETDFAPCVDLEKANSLFQHCCRQYAPEGCLPLCQYENDELAARNLVN
jgi:hypothetical protein